MNIFKKISKARPSKVRKNPDQEIIKRVLAGNKEAFSELISKYQKPVFSYIIRILNFHQEDAEDALSETFLKAYVNLASFNTKLKFFSWLTRIAHNEAVNIIRKKSKNYTVEIKDYKHSVNLDFDKPNKNDIEKILKSLKVRERQIITLFYIQDLSIKDIAEILKISTGSVKVRLNRARNKARKIVQKNYHKET